MENRYKLTIFPKAAEDLEGIFNYIVNDLCNRSAALKLIEKIKSSLVIVCEFPVSCPKANNELLVNVELRKLIVDNYILFYKVSEQTHEIQVVRVLYGMMNYKDVL